MHGNVLWCFLKQLCHLSLCQPNGLVFQSDINLCLSVLRLIDYNFVLFHNILIIIHFLFF